MPHRALAGGNSAAARRLDCSDVYFLHCHHRIKRALCFATFSARLIKVVLDAI
jgi:hypothetical protein